MRAPEASAYALCAALLPDIAPTAAGALGPDATDRANHIECQARMKTVRAWFLAQIKAGTLVP